MGRILSARGSDAQNVHIDDLFRVAFRRLVINDLSGGDQLFRSAEGRLTVVNGEIYNHAELARRHLAGARLWSRSDCEVVLHLFKMLGTALFAAFHPVLELLVVVGVTALARVELRPRLEATHFDRLVRSEPLDTTDLVAAFGLSATESESVLEAFLAQDWLIDYLSAEAAVEECAQ
jgi:hypothetical protein